MNAVFANVYIRGERQKSSMNNEQVLYFGKNNPKSENGEGFVECKDDFRTFVYFRHLYISVKLSQNEYYEHD